MKDYIRESIASQISDLFIPSDAETVLSWWIANEGRRPVIVVGAGFSRNAVLRSTGRIAGPENVPLWADVSRALASDLRIEDPTGIDPLTLAELHRSGMGPRRFVDLMRELLADDELEPGDAHKALFDFDAEAIVTTNFLDTLLDRDRRCVPIFDDLDVARRIEKTSELEVLYFHGHRSTPGTWVATRNQYEDNSAVRPAMLARVRQLLSQHPVLTVGYSLADPDFHQICRQISLDSKMSHPMGLALLGPAMNAETSSEYESAQRRHWESIGLRFARFNGWQDFPKKLTRFFSLARKITVEEIKSAMSSETSFERRTSIARSAIEDTKALNYIEYADGWQQSLWIHAIEAEFSSSEKLAFDESVRAFFQSQYGTHSREHFLEVGSDGGIDIRTQKAPPVSFRSSALEGNANKSLSFSWLVDYWLSGRRATSSALATWLTYATRRELLSQDSGSELTDTDLAVLSVAAWCELLNQAKDKTQGPPAGEIQTGIDAAYRLIVRYGDTAEQEAVRTLVARAGMTFSVPAEEPEANPHMQLARSSMLKGKYTDAAAEYDAAHRSAVAGDDTFLAWLATYGQWDACSRAHQQSTQSAPTSTEEDPQVAALKKKLLKAAQAEQVVRWKSAAQTRLAALQKKNISDLIDERRTRGIDSRGINLSSVAHFAWRTLRDLEARCAPPILQQPYIEALIAAEAFPIDVALEYRLKYAIPKTDVWLSEALAKAASSLTEATELHTSVKRVWLKTWRAAECSPRAILACLELVGTMCQILVNDEVDTIISLLRMGPDLDRQVWGHSGWKVSDRVAARSWQTYASGLRDKDSFIAFCSAATTSKSKPCLDEMVRSLGSLPWYHWIVLGVATADELLCFALDQCSGTESRSRAGVDAILKIVGNARFGTSPIKDSTWDYVARFIRGMYRTPDLRSLDDTWLVSALEISTHRAINPEKPGDDWSVFRADSRQFMTERLPIAQQRASKGDSIELANIVAALAVLEDAWGQNEWSKIVDNAWNGLLSSWQNVKHFVSNNTQYVSSIAWYLASTLKRGAVERHTEARSLLLELIDCSSEALTPVAEVFSEERWGDDWATLFSRVRDAINGNHGRFSVSYRMDACSLVQRVAATGVAATSNFQALLLDVSGLVAHENLLVANHAAYAIATCSSIFQGDEETSYARSRVLASLRAMTRDTRLPVRHAAAFASGRIHKLTKIEEFKNWATEARASLTAEPYLIMRRQYLIGEAEAESLLRQKR